jgi:predicted CopG family antitoxin
VNQPHTPRRTFRIPDDLYAAAAEKADAEGRSLSDVIRELLTTWVDEDV